MPGFVIGLVVGCDIICQWDPIYGGFVDPLWVAHAFPALHRSGKPFLYKEKIRIHMCLQLFNWSNKNKDLFINKMHFLGGPLVKTPCLQCRRHGFDPWSGNYGPTCCTEQLKEFFFFKEKKKWKKKKWSCRWALDYSAKLVSWCTCLLC